MQFLHKLDNQRALNQPNNLDVKDLNNCVKIGGKKAQ